MYDGNEAMLIEHRIAEQFDEPVHMDKDGNIVDNEAEAYGRPVTIDIKHPDYLILLMMFLRKSSDGELLLKRMHKRLCKRGSFGCRSFTKRCFVSACLTNQQKNCL